MSATSGTVSSPPRPTTSTGMPRAASAARSAGNWARLRQSTAMSRGCTPSARPSGDGSPSGASPAGSASSVATCSATQSASAAAVSVSAQVTRPRPAGPAAAPAAAPRGRPRAALPAVRPRRRGPGRCCGNWWTACGLALAGPPAPGPARQRNRARRPHREVAAEPAQVARAGPAPAIDGLARVAHRGHRVTAAEQGPQQDQLGMAGVLVLVQQHHLVPAALGRAHLGMRGRDPGRERHLVTIVDDLARGLGPRVTGHHRQQLLAGPLAVQILRPWRAAATPACPAAPRPRVQPLPHCGHVVRRAQVLGQLTGQISTPATTAAATS